MLQSLDTLILAQVLGRATRGRCAEIAMRFEAEWVLVEAPETNACLEVQSSKVRWHSQDWGEVYRKAVALRPQRFAMLYTGKMPGGTAVGR
jgi:hypothetical protein